MKGTEMVLSRYKKRVHVASLTVACSVVVKNPRNVGHQQEVY